LWQPDQRVFQQMMDELTEPNHPEHSQGNGPEQDYLSRFWADAPWTNLGVEFNYQLHQMFFAIHPDKVFRTERAKVLSEAQDKVKIVHYSGVATTKPWCRVLDEKWKDWWPPNRTRDKEYAAKNAEEFQGYWLWVKKDRATFQNATRNPTNWDVKGMYIGSDGEIYRSDWEGKGVGTEHLVIPEYATKGTMEFLETVLREWFDCLQELEQEMGLDLQEAMRAASSEADAVLPSIATESSSAKGEEKVPAAEAAVVRGGEQITSSGSTGGANGVKLRSVGNAQTLTWEKPQGGWWFERGRSDNDIEAAKASTLCGIIGGRRFVTFIEAGKEVFDDSGEDLDGVFVKVAGPHSARRFDVPPGDTDKATLEEALTPLSIWAEGVPTGAVVLLALLGVPHEMLAHILQALGPLGNPRYPPPAGTRALAAVGRCQGMSSPTNPCWHSSHASADVAHVSMRLKG